MKLNLLLLALIAVVSYVTCKNFQQTAATDKSAVTTATGAATTVPSDADTAKTTQNLPPAVKTPPLTHIPIESLQPPTASRKAYLNTGWWNVQAAVSGSPNEDMLIAQYRHKWMKFQEDQTFTILVNNKAAGSGRWGWDENKMQLYLSCSDPFLNGAWKVKSSGFKMVWIGNSEYTTHGHQLKIINSGQEPPSN
jgi:hypothetical protein